MIKTPVNTIFSVMIIEEICKIVKKNKNNTEKCITQSSYTKNSRVYLKGHTL